MAWPMGKACASEFSCTFCFLSHVPLYVGSLTLEFGANPCWFAWLSWALSAATPVQHLAWGLQQGRLGALGWDLLLRGGLH